MFDVSRTLIFTYGRFNPPTIGHKKLINLMKFGNRMRAEDGERCSIIIGVSRSHDKKKNPLSSESKMKWLHTYFPDINFNLATDAEPSFVQMLEKHSAFYNKLIFICGEDRKEEYIAILDKYNDSLFQFDEYSVGSGNLYRDNSDNIEGMSGSKMRQYVVNNDYESFLLGLPSTTDAELIWEELREALK